MNDYNKNSENANWNFPESNYAQRTGISEAGIETFRGSLFASLAKEICQNSLDAKLDNKDPVVVEFSKFTINTANIPGYKELNDAITKCFNTNSDKKAHNFFKTACESMSKKEINVLRASDFNTTGLKGSKEPITSINPWQSLIKSSGISDKTSSSGGSYGIGKSAPFACSEIRTIFYSTFDIDGNIATQGVSRLISFPITGDRLTQGIGYYGETEKNTPLFHELFIDKNFKRFGKTGTDLYILGFLENQKWVEELVIAVLDSFLISIYNNKMIVKINDLTISQATLREIIDKFKIDEKKKYKSIWDYYRVLSVTSGYENNSDGFLIGNTFKDLGDFELRILYEDLNRKVLVARSNGMKIFDLDRFPSALQFSAVFILKGERLNSYFREMETPQHDDWEPDRHSDKNAKNVLSDLKKLIRNKIVELGKTNTEERMDAVGIGDYLPDNLILLNKKALNNKVDKISNKTKSLDLTQVEGITKKRNKKKIHDENDKINELSEFRQNENTIGTFEIDDEGNLKLFEETANIFTDGSSNKSKSNSSTLNKEFSFFDGENEIIVKKVNLIEDVNIRLIMLNKKMKKYKLIIVPKKDSVNVCVKISLSGEQSNLKSKIRNAYKDDDINLPLLIKEDKIYIDNLTENQKFSLSFILNYLDDCSMEVELYEYRT